MDGKDNRDRLIIKILCGVVAVLAVYGGVATYYYLVYRIKYGKAHLERFAEGQQKAFNILKINIDPISETPFFYI